MIFNSIWLDKTQKNSYLTLAREQESSLFFLTFAGSSFALGALFSTLLLWDIMVILTLFAPLRELQHPIHLGVLLPLAIKVLNA